MFENVPYNVWELYRILTFDYIVSNVKGKINIKFFMWNYRVGFEMNNKKMKWFRIGVAFFDTIAAKSIPLMESQKWNKINSNSHLIV